MRAMTCLDIAFNALLELVVSPSHVELLVGADIIGTIIAPLTFTSVGLRGIILIIRTFLSFSLETEIEGCWPWQRRAARKESADEANLEQR